MFLSEMKGELFMFKDKYTAIVRGTEGVEKR